MNLRTRFLWCISLIAIAAMSVYAQNTNLLKNGGFESGKPSLYTAEAGASGATLTWAQDQKHSGTRSLKVEKAGTSASARWVSGNNVRYWVDKVSQGVDIKIGAWVKTSGVNTSPANADARWSVKYTFYDTNMVIIGAPIALNVDQSVATKDWYADTNAVGSVILPKDAYKVIISAEAGAAATGTVWFDDFIFVGRGGAWAGQNWNGFVDADSAWQYWIAPMGGNDGASYFPGSGVTTEQARTGTSSLKITAPVGRETGELVWFTETVPVVGGKSYVVSAWVKTSDIKPDSVFNASSQLGFTATWHSKLFADAGGWNEFAGADYRFALKDASTDWTQYFWVLTAPADAKAISVRARTWPLWTGTSYWDDFAVNQIETAPTSVQQRPTVNGTMVPEHYSLEQNYPNPFNPTTNIVYSLANSGSVKLEVFNILGQKVATVVNEVQNAGVWTARWNGTDETGSLVSSGIYLYRLTTNSYVSTKKMMFIK
ncbi:MAG: T9SS type A sorting domain-containing protein [Bacteroidota bacterium]